ncbi:hypothetical protein [uncultured Cohaesibacter sp.]|uniref:hypothetical protein n=1 Tax=uncultured Cohaesibacter sp. TaxID=1002546 RepID=UPI002AA71D78|nr:hypothetical protein [uncultured Cohaesibacter sp.]
MKTPEWLKPGLYGAVIGAVCVGVIGFAWGGWMTASGSNKMAMSMAHDDVIAALVPVCVDQSNKDLNRQETLTKIKDASSYKRRDVVMESGWATVPGAEKPNRDLAQACLIALKIDK